MSGQRDDSKLSGPEFVKLLLKGYNATSLYDQAGKVYVRLGWTPTVAQRRAAEQAGFHLLTEDEKIDPRDMK